MAISLQQRYGDGYSIVNGKPTNTKEMEQMLEVEGTFSQETKDWLADNMIRRAIAGGLAPEVAEKLYR